MYLKDIIFEDFVNYWRPSMFVICGNCDGKCWVERGLPPTTCQNHGLNKLKDIYVSSDNLIRQYLNNPIVNSIVFGGLEPMTVFDDIYNFTEKLRATGCLDDVVIYTGFYPDEIEEQLKKISPLGNIIFKFGRYVPGDEPHYDDVLGIKLASNNQWGEKIS